MDDDESSYEEHIPLCERPEWADVLPLELPGDREEEEEREEEEAAAAGAKPSTAHVVAIQYTPLHREALGYFRRIKQLGEYSERVLALTADLISYNQADYTAWEWRWRCLRALNKDLTTEYTFTDGIMHDNAKNYQLWNHRRKCAMALGAHAAARELAVAADALQVDAKNYHAWAHRQAIVKEYGGALWEEELAFCEDHINKDIRNNSAWNQRAFIVFHQVTAQGAVVEDDLPSLPASAPQKAPVLGLPLLLRQILARELEYLVLQVALAPRNESVWNYLRGLFSLPGLPPNAMGLFDEVDVICREALVDAPSSPSAMDVHADYYMHLAYLALQFLQAAQEQIKQQMAARQQTAELAQVTIQDVLRNSFSPEFQTACTAAITGIQTAVAYCVNLLEALVIADPVRAMYWRHRAQAAQQLLLLAGVGPAQVAGAPQQPAVQ